MFGDDDPEDAWDASDPIPVKVSIIERWVVSIRMERLGPHSHPRVVERLRLALRSVEGVSLLTQDLEVLEVLGHARDRLLEMREEEGA
jgi:hypothetical protein